MRAALRHLADRADGRRGVAVLGDMAELGVDAPLYHAEIGHAATEAGVDLLVAVGPLAQGQRRRRRGRREPPLRHRRRGGGRTARPRAPRRLRAAQLASRAGRAR